MERPTIWFCEINLENGARKARETLEKDPNLNVIGYGCLKRCKKCDLKLYGVVNGDVIEADDSEELVKNIYEHIDKNILVG
ncbi:DUF1450 domain-containing protein [Niallia sp. Krafla_26]|uniref:DUF1450 domain-containing protein n=1 Tax=Niallia sp. Krafla_26 TaxID=3064703 RepID=UPI003D166619